MNKFFAIILASLALSSVACSPSISEPRSPALEPTMVQKDPVHSPSAPECHCEGKGGDCLLEGAKKIGEGTWDLTKRGAQWTSDQVHDEGNQKKIGEAWESVKSGASDLYDRAKDAVK
jgi:hypothetical protein